jgi:hypothetical protein
MSDVPELDRLLDEHETYRRNMAWNRQEAFFVMTLRTLAAGIASVVLYAAIGFAAVALFPALYDLAEWALPKPQRRDPFKRYRSM